MHTSIYDPGLSDTALLPALLQATGINVLRYPGGTYSDSYHWAQHTMTPFFASTAPACGIAANGYLAPNTSFGYFLKTLQATGAQAIITVNYGTGLGDSSGTRATGTFGPSTCSEPGPGGQPQEAAAWVAYANGSPSSTQSIGLDAVGFDWKTVGFWASLRAASPLATDDGYNQLRLGITSPIGIKYWEIGNELYYNGYSSNINTESDNHAPYIYPSGYAYTGSYASRDSVAGLGPTDYGTNAIAFLQAMRAVDPTIKIGFVDPIPATWNPAALQAVCTSAAFDFAILHYYPGTYNAVTAAQLLSSPQVDMPALMASTKSLIAQYCPASAAAVQYFVTETNPNGTLDTGVPTQITGLFATHQFLTSLENGVANVDWLELHSGNYLTDTTEAPGPAYFGLELAYQLAGVGDQLVTSTSSSATILSHASLKANGKKGLVLINADPLNPALVQVTLTGGAGGASATQYSYGLATTQTGTTLAGTAFPIPAATFTITVPPYTATELIIP
jgi:hypothetical protein